MPKVKWAKPYLTILEPRIQEWARANGDRRHEVENEVLLAVQSAHKEGGSSKALPVNLLSSIANWFNNHRLSSNNEDAPQHKKGVKSFTKEKTLRDAIVSSHGDEIMKIVEEDYGITSTKDPKFVGAYSKALASLKGKLESEEIERLEALVRKWNSEAMPSELQAKNAEASLSQTATRFIEDGDRAMGVQYLILARFKNTKGEICRQTFVSSPKKGENFKTAYPNWKKDVWGSWNSYSEDQLNEDSENDVPDEDEGVRRNRGLEKLIADKGGVIKLPKQGSMSLIEKKQVIRAYVTEIYRKFTNNPTVSVPWTEMMQPSSDYILPSSLPEGCKLQEPTKTRETDISKYWEHWLKHPLTFVSAPEKDIRSKDKAAKEKEKSVSKTDKGTSDQSTNGDDGIDKSVDESNDGSVDPEDEQGNEQEVHPAPPCDESETRESRLEYIRKTCISGPLESLCSIMANMARFPEEGMKIPRIPKWTSWDYSESYLSDKFHKKGGIAGVLTAVRHMPKGLYSYDGLELIALMCGMAIRDIYAAHFQEPGANAPDIPQWLVNSPHSIENVHELETAMDGLTSHLGDLYKQSTPGSSSSPETAPNASKTNKRKKDAESPESPRPTKMRNTSRREADRKPPRKSQKGHK